MATSPIPITKHQNLLAALSYANRGWWVFPIYEVTSKGYCSCSAKKNCQSPGKHPRLSRGYRASTDPEQIRKWWTDWPMANIAIQPSFSGLIVLDIDPRNAGDTSLAELEAEHGVLPHTITALTGGGGQHYLFARPSTSQALKTCTLAQGVEVKADTGYIVAPPSMHFSGKQYVWDAGADPEDTEVVSAPEWLIKLVAKLPTDYRPGLEAVADGLMGCAFAAAGKLGRYVGLDKATVVCPWEKYHTTGKKHDGSTVVFAPQQGKRLGWFHCSHAHCSKRSQEAVLQTLPGKAVIKARNYLHIDPDASISRLEEPKALKTIDDRWKVALRVNDKCQLTRDPGNAALILANEPQWQGRLKFNRFGNDVLVADKLPEVPGLIMPKAGEPLTEDGYLYIAHWFARARNVSFSLSIIKDAIYSAAKVHTIDPLLDYLDSLEWDGVERTKHWLCDHLGAKATEFTMFASDAWLISAIARAYQPGCQVDHTLVLESKRQGLGKSRTFRIMAGPFFLENLPSLRDKDAAIALGGRWVVCVEELDAIRQAEVSQVKAFLTQTTDIYRPPYGRIATKHFRRCVFGATTNEGVYLNDPTGARRFWPVRCHEYLDAKALLAARDQLWAEARDRYFNGIPWHPTPEMEVLAGTVQTRRRAVDPWEEVLEAYIGHGNRDNYTTAELFSHIGFQSGDLSRIEKRSSFRLGRVMRSLGYGRQRIRPKIDSNPVWRWVKMEEDEED